MARCLVGRQDLVAKPGSKGVGIRHSERTEAQQGTNLTAQALTVATGQIEIIERLRGDGQLLREILHTGVEVASLRNSPLAYYAYNPEMINRLVYKVCNHFSGFLEL